MNDQNKLTETLRTFHYSTLLPASLVVDGSPVYSLPETITYLSSIVKDAYKLNDLVAPTSTLDFEKASSYYIHNDFEESFIILQVAENSHIVAGPFLNNKVFEGHINNIIRLNILPIKLKAKLVAYYDHLPVIDNNRSYYCGKLLESLCMHSVTREQKNPDTIARGFVFDDYFTETIKNRESLYHHPPYFLEQELLAKIKAGNLGGTMTVLSEINSLKRTRLSKDALRSVKNSLICSITLFTRAAIEGGVTPEAAFTLSDAIILEIEEMNSLPALMDYEYSAAEQYVKIVQDLSKSKYSNVIQQATSYIYKNLTNKLTLKQISEAVYVHPNYLSTLFKREVGMSLSDYIMKMRVDEAKYYIRYTNTRISDIALFYQFCNQSYFTQAFKKFIGLTPNEYRIEHNQQNE